MATFPVLKTPDLVQNMLDIGQPLSADDIDRPTSAKLIPIYFYFWNQMTDQTLEEVRMAAQIHIERLQQHESSGVSPVELEGLTENIHLGVLYETLNQLMRWAMIEDFTMRDLRDPQAPRVRRILSALINFHLFQQEQGPLIDKLEEEYEAGETSLIRAMDEMEAWKSKLEQKRSQLAREADEIVRLGKENLERRDRLIRAKEMEEPALARLEQGKRERATLQEKIENITMSLKQHDAEITRLRGRIVQSPDRVRQTLDDMQKSLQNIKDETLELDKKSREHEARIQVSKKYEQDITSVIKLLDEWGTELERLHAASSQLYSLTEARDAATQDLQELELRYQQLERRATTTSEQITRQTETHTNKKQAVRERMATLQETYSSLMNQREGLQAEQDVKMKEIRGLEDSISELVKNTEKEVGVAEAAWRELKDDVLTYANKLNKAVDHLNIKIETPFKG